MQEVPLSHWEPVNAEVARQRVLVPIAWRVTSCRDPSVVCGQGGPFAGLPGEAHDPGPDAACSAARPARSGSPGPGEDLPGSSARALRVPLACLIEGHGGVDRGK